MTQSVHQRNLLLAAATFALIGFQLAAVAQSLGRQGPLELTSALGRKLYALPDDPKLTQAKAALAGDPKNPALALALSLAQAGRRQYNEAVATDSAALAFAPKNADLYLERGHRELGLRKFKPAQADLEHAAQLDPKMLDAFYHLGLAHYFQGAATNGVNTYLINQETKNSSFPDLFTPDGFVTAQLLAHAIDKADGDTNVDKMISAL